LKPLLSLNEISYLAGDPKKGMKEILKNINLSIFPKEIIGIAGESGSGKSTLAKIMSDIVRPSGGLVESTGVRVRLLFQNSGEILNPYRKVSNVINEAIKINNSENSYAELIKLLSIPSNISTKSGFQLSGGMQQRVALARLLASKADILILDEPFSAQDPIAQVELYNLLLKLNKELDITLICISHNLKMLKKICGRIIILHNGEIVEEGEPEQIFNSPVHSYTKYLIKGENYDLSSDELFFNIKN
jgi:peptide/nickel transport system ATP-binding protein